MFERKIHIINDKKKLLKYICLKSLFITLYFVVAGLVLYYIGNLVMELLYDAGYKLKIWQVILSIVTAIYLYIAFVYTYYKKYSFNLLKVGEETITICYEDYDRIYKLDDIYLERKKKSFKIVLKKNKNKFTIPLFMLKDSDFRNISTDMKKYNVKIKR